MENVFNVDEKKNEKNDEMLKFPKVCTLFFKRVFLFIYIFYWIATFCIIYRFSYTSLNITSIYFPFKKMFQSVEVWIWRNLVRYCWRVHYKSQKFELILLKVGNFSVIETWLNFLLFRIWNNFTSFN